MAQEGEIVPNGDEPPLTPAELLTQQFYAWERRGRGWRVWPYAVEFEPPFRPFFYHYAPGRPAFDDGRKPTFFSSLVDRLLGGPPSTQAAEYLPEDAEPEPEPADDESDLVELQISLPSEEKKSVSAAEQFLLSLTYATRPVSFEVIGLADSITVQFTCRARDEALLREQLRAHFPGVVLSKGASSLEKAWERRPRRDERKEILIVDFGLSREFMLPLRSAKSFEVDPLVATFGALEDVRQGELGLVQVLFRAARHPWAGSVTRSLTDWEGGSFFADAPELLPQARQKIAKPLFAAVVRVAAQSPTHGRAWEIAKALGGAFAQFSDPLGNELIPLSNDGYRDEDHAWGVTWRRSWRSGMLLNSDELVSFVHLPSSSVATPKLRREIKTTKVAPAIGTGHRLVLGENVHEGKVVPVSLGAEQRLRHTYVIGASGTGKSTLLGNLIVQDIEQGEGVGVIDPHGDLAEEVLARIPEKRHADVILFDPQDRAFPIGLNVLLAHSEVEKQLLASDLVATFRRLSTSWGDQMNAVLANAVLAFLESPQGGTLGDLRRFLVDERYREEHLAAVTDPGIRFYWEREFPLLSGRPQASILTRLDTFLRPQIVRNMVMQRESRIHFREVLDRGKILLCKLAQGGIGVENAALLGALLVSSIEQAAISRQEAPERERRNFYLYIDEFQNVITPSLESMLSGARKYHLGLILAHQELRQLWSRDREVASSVLANAGTRICFRVGEFDAAKLEGGFASFEPRDLLNLSVGEAIARIERSDWDFNLRTLKPPAVDPRVASERRRAIQALSRSAYARPLEEVEAEVSAQTATEAKARKLEARSAPVPPPASPTEPGEGVPSLDERAFLDFVSRNPGCFVTNAYAALGLSGYKGDKLKEALLSKGLLAQQETRQGEGRRVAKTLALTPEGVKLLAALSSELPGKGGDAHRRLQAMIKEQAELLGWRATIEERMGKNGGQADVGLEKEDLAVAAEISITTDSDHEISNIQKCLAGGYDYVVWVCQEEARLQSVKSKGRRVFSLEERRRIRYVHPGKVPAALQELAGTAVVSAREGGNSPRRIQNPLLGVKEAAEFLGVSPMTLYGWVSQKKIPHIKVGRLTKFNRSNLERWLEGQSRQEREERWR